MLRPLAILALAAFASPAQTFEVASIKRSAPDNTDGSRTAQGFCDGERVGRTEFYNAPLKWALMAAYEVASDQIVGPDWIANERYTIVAKAPPRTTPEQARAMLRNLLAERFRMSIHEETRPRPEFALLPGNGPPKFKVSKPGSDSSFEIQSDKIPIANFSMKDFASLLSDLLHRRVVDETGLAGRYDMILNASAEDIESGALVTAITDLGLKLETRRVPAKFIVVDKAEKIPTDN
jgi:uncharacterized protein (TIGR03435 family)